MRKEALTYISSVLISALSITTAVCAFRSGKPGFAAISIGVLAISLVLLMIRYHLQEQQSLDNDLS